MDNSDSVWRLREVCRVLEEFSAKLKVRGTPGNLRSCYRETATKLEAVTGEDERFAGLRKMAGRLTELAQATDERARRARAPMQERVLKAIAVYHSQLGEALPKQRTETRAAQPSRTGYAPPHPTPRPLPQHTTTQRRDVCTGDHQPETPRPLPQHTTTQPTSTQQVRSPSSPGPVSYKSRTTQQARTAYYAGRTYTPEKKGRGFSWQLLGWGILLLAVVGGIVTWIIIANSAPKVSRAPASSPTSIPWTVPQPTVQNTARSTARSTARPTAQPTVRPTARNTARPVAAPTVRPTARPTVHQAAPVECCKHCNPAKSKPCGDSCISLDKYCDTPPGCACSP